MSSLTGCLGLGLDQTWEHMHKEVGPSVDIILASFQRRAKKIPEEPPPRLLLLLLSSNHRHPAPKDVLALAACGFKVLFLTEQAISRASFLEGTWDLMQLLRLGTWDLWDSKGPHGGNATTFLMGAFVGRVAQK